MEPKRFTIDRTYRRDDPLGAIVAHDRAGDDLRGELWAKLGDEWLAVRRTPTSYRVISDIGPAGYTVISAGFEIMPIDAREYVAVPSLPYVVVEYKQDWRLVAAILGLLLLVVMLAVM